jgi:hypothetical protein
MGNKELSIIAGLFSFSYSSQETGDESDKFRLTGTKLSNKGTKLSNKIET